MPSKSEEPRAKYYTHNPNAKFWTFKRYPKMKFNNHQCRTCIYRSNHDENTDRIHCDYIGFTGHIRGCHPSPTCTKYVKGKRSRKRSEFNPKHKAGFSNTIDEPPFARLKRFTK